MNESSTDKVMRQLREENDRLKKALERGVVELSGENPSLSENGKRAQDEGLLSDAFHSQIYTT